MLGEGLRGGGLGQKGAGSGPGAAGRGAAATLMPAPKIQTLPPPAPTCFRKASTLSSWAREGQPPASFISAPGAAAGGVGACGNKRVGRGGGGAQQGRGARAGPPEPRPLKPQAPTHDDAAVLHHQQRRAVAGELHRAPPPQQRVLHRVWRAGRRERGEGTGRVRGWRMKRAPGAWRHPAAPAVRPPPPPKHRPRTRHERQQRRRAAREHVGHRQPHPVVAAHVRQLVGDDRLRGVRRLFQLDWREITGVRVGPQTCRCLLSRTLRPGRPPQHRCQRPPPSRPAP
jgi:hypothetical protein